MRTLIKLVAGAAAAATVAALAVVPAMADPITNSGRAVTPRATDIVGVGSDTIQDVFDQFSIDFNNSVKASAPHLYSWNALNPTTGLTDKIKGKSGCAVALRPNGSSGGILAATGGPLALSANTKTKDKKHFCTDFARSSRARATGDPANGPGGVSFVPLGKDAVTYATNAITDAPKNLTTADLNKIYNCTVRNWQKFGGKSGIINAQLPQVASGTRKFFLTAIGVQTPGKCVNSLNGEHPTTANPDGNFPEENEGVNKFLAGKNTIYPFSIGKYIAEVFHSAKCVNKACTAVKGVICKTAKGKNRFGCDTHGTMVLHSINKTAPTVGTGSKTTVNRSFTPAFVRTVYVVVRWAKTKDNIPSYLESLFGAHGWTCTSKAARADLLNYGFLPTPFCGR